MFWTGALLAFALSIDGFIAGLSYGVRQIKMPNSSLLIIAGCTGIGMGASMLFGGVVSRFIDMNEAQTIGGVILVGVGLWHLFQAWSQYVYDQAVAAAPDKALFAVRIRPLRIVVHVLADPTHVDRDLSGTIDMKEALVLGIALGMDTVGAGLAAAMLGYGLSLVVFVSVGLPLLVWIGMMVGRQFDRERIGSRGMFLPGAVLMLMGMLQF